MLALEGRLSEEAAPVSPEVDEMIDEVHEMVSATREGLETREVSASTIRRYTGKN